MARRLLYSSVLGLALTIAGLLNLTILDRALVQPKFEPYASHFVQARGWPLAWLVTEPGTAERPLHFTERWLMARFLTCWAGAALLVWAALAAAGRWRLLVRGGRRHG